KQPNVLKRGSKKKKQKENRNKHKQERMGSSALSSSARVPVGHLETSGTTYALEALGKGYPRGGHMLLNEGSALPRYCRIERWFHVLVQTLAQCGLILGQWLQKRKGACWTGIPRQLINLNFFGDALRKEKEKNEDGNPQTQEAF